MKESHPFYMEIFVAQQELLEVLNPEVQWNTRHLKFSDGYGELVEERKKNLKAVLSRAYDFEEELWTKGINDAVKVSIKNRIKAWFLQFLTS